MKHNHPRKWSTMDLMMYADNELDHQQRKHLRADLRVSRELQAQIRPFIETRAALVNLTKIANSITR